MIMFYDAMWSIITYSCIWGLVSSLLSTDFRWTKTVEYESEQCPRTFHGTVYTLDTGDVLIRDGQRYIVEILISQYIAIFTINRQYIVNIVKST